ncbi:MAG: sulfatase [Lentisphaeraceae bacterium]|nr:sulfatase [Lentisphaeraceae bacterium]
MIKRFVSVLLFLISFSANSQQKPNVIFFAVDDMNDWISPMGYKGAKTPNLDRLAKMGVTFQNAHSPATYCAPSRSAIFSGRFATTTGCYKTQVYFHEHPEMTPLQVNFKKAGYKTFGGGKLFHHREGFVDLRGWDKFFVRNEAQKKLGWPAESWSEDTPLPAKIPASPYNEGKKVTGGLFLEWSAIPNEKEGQMADTQRIDWACSVIEEKHDAPFFVGVGIYAPHFPNYVPQKYFDMYKRDEIKLPPYKEDDLDDLPPKIRKAKMNRKKAHHDKLVKMNLVEDAILGYLASISYADAMLGKVLDSLENSPNKDNTIVVFWSDHGYHHGEKGDWGKHTLWERTSNVPFLWAGPGIAKNKSVDASVSLIDMYPSFNELCGLPKEDGLDGTSLAPVLAKPETAKDRNVFLPYLEPYSYAVINQKYRYIHYADNTEELYDLEMDPNEWNNAAANPEYKSIKEQLKNWAPKKQVKPGADKADRNLKLVLEGEKFHWVNVEPKALKNKKKK